LEEVSAAMQVPCPELTYLYLGFPLRGGDTPPVIPDSFLGGSAPRLRNLELSGIPFPGLPKLLLSATQLVELKLLDIPLSGYLSPEAMAASLSVLPSLMILWIVFQCYRPRPDRKDEGLPPPKRSVLPTLIIFDFEGATEYLEDLVTFIDAPQLSSSKLAFFDEIDSDCPQLTRFIDCAPKLSGYNPHGHVQFDDRTPSVKLQHLTITILCREPDQQLLSIGRICNSYFPSLFTVEIEDLQIFHPYSKFVWEGDAIEDTLWLRLLLPFTGVKKIWISEKFVPGIAAALGELVGERTAEVLPSLQKMSVAWPKTSGPSQENIEKFVTARRLSGHPVAVN
jgi:hypothetical protein